MSARWKEALDLCREILDAVSDVPAEGEDFAASVEENTLDIMEWIEEKKWVTDAQLRALENMQAGLRRWTDD